MYTLHHIKPPTNRRKKTTLRGVAGGRTKLLIATFVAAAVIMTGMIIALRPTEPTGTTTAANQTNSQKAGSDTRPLASKRLYVDGDSNASRQANIWRADRPADAAQMDKLAKLPEARWITDDSKFAQLAADIRAAEADGSVVTSVAYNIPQRDCGLYSAGGAGNGQAYKTYVDKYVGVIGSAAVVVILEPDALAQLVEQQGQDCLNKADQQLRLDLLQYAVTAFQKLPATLVYIDAGNSGWVNDMDQLAGRLQDAGIAEADGFSVNVSNFRTTEESSQYGNELASRLDGKHYVIDTSRNGLGNYQNKARPDYSWCNPPGRALGHYPTTDVDNPLVDAYLFIKRTGESDGSDPDSKKCFDGPRAGQWSAEYALGLVQRWPKELQP